MANHKKQPIRRLTATQLTEVNEFLDKDGDTNNSADERRTYRRFNFRTSQIIVNITHPGGGTSTVAAGTRNLSSGGLAFVYWGFLHNDTGCEIIMKTQGGQTQTSYGKVVSCRHVSGTHHLIGVQFDTLIDPWLFFREKTSSKTSAKQFTVDKDFKARVLYIAGAASDHEMASACLAGTHFELTVAAEMQNVVEQLKNVRFDVLLCDIDITGPSGSALITTIHALAPNQPIIVLSSTDGEIESTSNNTPAHTIINKPYDKNQLLDVLLLCLSSGHAVDHHIETIASQFGHNKDMLYSIESFLQQIEHNIEHMRQAAVANDIQTVQSLCEQLKLDGRQYGYPSLTQTAAEVISVLEKSNAVIQSCDELDHLIILCQNLTVK